MIPAATGLPDWLLAALAISGVVLVGAVLHAIGAAIAGARARRAARGRRTPPPPRGGEALVGRAVDGEGTGPPVIHPAPRPPAPPAPGTRDYYRQQVELIRGKGYRSKRLLNKGEQQVFWALVRWGRREGLRIFPQVSLGEVFTSSDEERYFAINSKRADFVLTDAQFCPLALIEYHGSGHWLSSDADARDDVKRAAAETAGLAYVAIRRGQEMEAAWLVETALSVRGWRPARRVAGSSSAG